MDYAGALEAWENRQSFLQRVQGVFTFGTILWSMGIAGILVTLIPFLSTVAPHVQAVSCTRAHMCVIVLVCVPF